MNSGELKEKTKRENCPEEVESGAPGKDANETHGGSGPGKEIHGRDKEESGKNEPDEGERETAGKEEEELNTRYMRLMADFQNYRKRTEKEKSDIYAYANEKIVTQLLDVIDNFERALTMEVVDEGFIEGMRMIFRQFMDVLEKAGLEEIDALGRDFDPNFHHAVMTGDDPGYESGKVTWVMQKGYLLNKKIIRPSMVKVNN